MTITYRIALHRGARHLNFVTLEEAIAGAKYYGITCIEHVYILDGDEPIILTEVIKISKSS